MTHGYDWRPEIYFIGHHMGSDAIRELLETLEGKEVAVNVISKSQLVQSIQSIQNVSIEILVMGKVSD